MTGLAVSSSGQPIGVVSLMATAWPATTAVIASARYSASALGCRTSRLVYRLLTRPEYRSTRLPSSTNTCGVVVARKWAAATLAGSNNTRQAIFDSAASRSTSAASAASQTTATNVTPRVPKRSASALSVGTELFAPGHFQPQTATTLRPPCHGAESEESPVRFDSVEHAQPDHSPLLRRREPLHCGRARRSNPQKMPQAGGPSAAHHLVRRSGGPPERGQTGRGG